MSRLYHFPGMFKEGLAGRSERNLALGAVEQLDVQFLFQSAHRRRQRRLHDMYPLGRLGKFISAATATKYSKCRSSTQECHRESRLLRSFFFVGRDRRSGVV
jgi:hypothetical protein